MDRLKSSFKSLQDVITNIKPTPTCIQQPQTLSFREADHLYSGLCTRLYPSHDDDDDDFFFSATPSPSTSCVDDEITYPGPPPIDILLPHLDDDCNMSSSSLRTITVLNEDASLGGDFEPGPVSSKRFFFSPRTTNSIMEEAKPPESGATAAASFCEGSRMVSLASRDPYLDFRASMEEMVAAHELRDWRCLQELLHCYLRLNEKKHHKVIVLAFVDLLMQLMSRDKEDR
ncbi:transcription repressor OFP13-like [Canna indica]|uniref:Transcription repressor n=1 Tax=Canna indica TaxID=4628 RepID=A0AAQ3KL92_9LILI|nr:transcription repressor OFP13-like [Canna indica]